MLFFTFIIIHPIVKYNSKNKRNAFLQCESSYNFLCAPHSHRTLG